MRARALEEYVNQYLLNHLISNDVEREDAVRTIGRYTTLHRTFNRGFRDIIGKSLRDNNELWQDFDKLRMLRKVSIHPFIRKATYEHAIEALQYYRKIRSWISRARE
jgi:hypothetical protein